MKLKIKLKDILVSVLFLTIVVLNLIKWSWLLFGIGFLVFTWYAILRLYDKDGNPLDNIQAKDSIGGGGISQPTGDDD